MKSLLHRGRGRCRKLNSIDLFSISDLHTLVTVDISDSTARMERCTLYDHVMLESTALCCSYTADLSVPDEDLSVPDEDPSVPNEIKSLKCK